MRCDGRPDPTKTREVNTFLSLLNENGSHELQHALDDVKLLLSVSILKATNSVQGNRY